MNLNTRPTQNELRDLLSNCHDAKYNHIIWVQKNGDVHITPLGNETPAAFATKNADLIQFRLETCGKGNNYTGPIAAASDNWVERVFNALIENWGKNTLGYIDNF